MKGIAQIERLTGKLFDIKTKMMSKIATDLFFILKDAAETQERGADKKINS